MQMYYFGRYPWSKALHLKCLQNQSQATIAWNAKHIMSSSEWLSMEYDFLQVSPPSYPSGTSLEY